MLDAVPFEFPQVGDGSFIEADKLIHPEELRLAFRNKAMPLEALRYDVTPTGMHYALIHYDIPAIDDRSWKLRVNSADGRATTFGLRELQDRHQRTVRVTMECAGDGRALTHPRSISQPWLTGAVGTADWTGTSLADLLREVDISAGAKEVVFSASDEGFEGGQRQHYQRSLPLEAALNNGVILAWAMNGAPLEPQHGFPLRLIVPGWYGMAHVKWLGAIDIQKAPFQGYQQTTAYRFSNSRDEPGDPVTLMRVRSLMIPPGVPDFLTRMRVVDRGVVELRGRAWSGGYEVTGVEISTDGGRAWSEASVDRQHYPEAWQSWRYVWHAEDRGAYELCCRASDSSGAVQPVDQFWTARGMGNNAVHRVRVVVV